MTSHDVDLTTFSDAVNGTQTATTAVTDERSAAVEQLQASVTAAAAGVEQLQARVTAAVHLQARVTEAAADADVTLCARRETSSADVIGDDDDDDMDDIVHDAVVDSPLPSPPPSPPPRWISHQQLRTSTSREGKYRLSSTNIRLG